MFKSHLVLSLIREKQKFIMKEGFYITDLELNKLLRKISKINKDNYDTLRAREDRKLRVKVRKYVKKVESKDEDVL